MIKKHRLKSIGKYILAAILIPAGLHHIYDPELYLEFAPPYIPFPLVMIYLSGFFEIILGISILMNRFRKLAAWCIFIMLLLFTPVYFYILKIIHCEGADGCWFLILVWIRLIFIQPLLLGFAWINTKD